MTDNDASKEESFNKAVISYDIPEEGTLMSVSLTSPADTYQKYFYYNKKANDLKKYFLIFSISFFTSLSKKFILK